jgi:hypothetical protein
MKDQVCNSDSQEGSNDFETRVAIDVMFEALSHIQASIDASSDEEERVKSYRRFKEALYERYEHLLEKRREEGTATSANEDDPALEKMNENGQVDDREAAKGADDEDTLGKLWPAVSDRSNTNGAATAG